MSIIKSSHDQVIHQRSTIILTLCLFCLVLTYAVTIENHIDVVYTHFFYLPIILAGFWFGNKAVPLALLLGCLHVYTNFLIVGNVIPSSIYRAFFLVSIAVIIALIAKTSTPSTRSSFSFSSDEDPSNQRGTLGNMVVALGHELRNPMTTVKGYMQLLQEQEEFENHQETFAMIIEDIDRANSTLHQCMSLSPQRSLNFQLVNLNKLIKRLAVSSILSRAKDADINVKLNLSPIPDLKLDTEEIEQLIIHLVQNAIEASPGQSTIYIRTFPKDETVILQIEDQGNGLPQELMADLGRPFLSTKPDHPGLGLAISYSIAIRHHAVIDVLTAESGTSIFIHFPIFKELIAKHE